MAKKTVNIHELTKQFNEFRQANQGRTFSTKNCMQNLVQWALTVVLPNN